MILLGYNFFAGCECQPPLCHGVELRHCTLSGASRRCLGHDSHGSLYFLYFISRVYKI